MKLDLTKNQLVEEDIQILVRDSEEDSWKTRYIREIDHRSELPYQCWMDGEKGGIHNYDTFSVENWKYAKLIPEEKMRWMSMNEVFDFIALNSNMLVSYNGNIAPANSWNYHEWKHSPEKYKYILVTEKDGKPVRSEPKLFQVPVED